MAWALLAVVALGFVPPARPQAQANDLATMGVAGVSGSAPALTGRRVRAKVARADGQPDGSNPLAWSHLPWLLATAQPIAPPISVGAIARAAAPVAPPSSAGTARTSRGPPPRS